MSDRARRTPLEKVLQIVTEVRPGEGGPALALSAGIFLLLTANYCLKPARDGLLASESIPGISDMELKAYSSFGQGILLFVALHFYSALSARFSRRSLITWVTSFLISNLLVFWVLQPGFLVDRIPFLGIGFYLWVGAFNVFVVAQFWAFATDIYSDQKGRRLFPLIAVGGTAGAVAGSWLVAVVLDAGWTGTYGLLPLGAGLVGVSLYLLRSAEFRANDDGSLPLPLSTTDRNALGLVFRNRYLLAMALVVLLLNWVKTNSDNLLFAVVQEALRGSGGGGISDAAIRDATTAFYADLFFWIGTSSLCLQVFGTSRLLRRGGLAPLLLALPILSLVSYSALAFLPALWLFRVTKIAEDSTNYSLNLTGSHVLWLPTTREMKYRAKAAVDTIFVRAGDGLAALTALVGVHTLALAPSAFFSLNVLLAAAWLVSVGVVLRENRRLIRT